MKTAFFIVATIALVPTIVISWLVVIEIIVDKIRGY